MDSDVLQVLRPRPRPAFKAPLAAPAPPTAPAASAPTTLAAAGPSTSALVDAIAALSSRLDEETKARESVEQRLHAEMGMRSALQQEVVDLVSQREIDRLKALIQSTSARQDGWDEKWEMAHSRINAVKKSLKFDLCGAISEAQALKARVDGLAEDVQGVKAVGAEFGRWVEDARRLHERWEILSKAWTHGSEAAVDRLRTTPAMGPQGKAAPINPFELGAPCRVPAPSSAQQAPLSPPLPAHSPVQEREVDPAPPVPPPQASKRPLEVAREKAKAAVTFGYLNRQATPDVAFNPISPSPIASPAMLPVPSPSASPSPPMPPSPPPPPSSPLPPVPPSPTSPPLLPLDSPTHLPSPSADLEIDELHDGMDM